MTAQIWPNKPRVRSTWNAVERARCIELFEKSGLTALEFCREHGLTPTLLAFWLSQHKDPFAGLTPVVASPIANPAPTAEPAAPAASDPDEAVFLEVPLTAMNEEAAPACATAVTVRLTSGVQLEVVTGTDPDWFSQLLAALRKG